MKEITIVARGKRNGTTIRYNSSSAYMHSSSAYDLDRIYEQDKPVRKKEEVKRKADIGDYEEVIRRPATEFYTPVKKTVSKTVRKKKTFAERMRLFKIRFKLSAKSIINEAISSVKPKVKSKTERISWILKRGFVVAVFGCIALVIASYQRGMLSISEQQKKVNQLSNQIQEVTEQINTTKYGQNIVISDMREESLSRGLVRPNVNNTIEINP